MKTIKTTIAILAVSIFAMSCSKDSEPTPNPADGIFRIQKREVWNQIETYEYNAQNKVTAIKSSFDPFFEFTYNSQGKMLSSTVGGYTDLVTNKTTDYVYNSAGFLIEELINYGNGTKGKITYVNNSGGYPISRTGYNYIASTQTYVANGKTTNTYNANNQLIKFDLQNSYYDFKVDSKGNRIELKEYNKKANGTFYLKTQSDRTYDDKKFIKTNPLNDNEGNVNNYIDYITKTYLPNGTLENQNSGTYSYEYNEAGYVTKKFIDGTLSETFTLEKVN